MNLETTIVAQYIDTGFYRALSEQFESSMEGTNVLSAWDHRAYQLASRIESEIRQQLPTAGLAGELLAASLGHVDFQALAASFME